MPDHSAGGQKLGAGKVLRLIERLQHSMPEFTIAILGEPGGAHFADGVPTGCVDLINVPSDRRMDIQIAALQKSEMALGSMSGALLVALAVGCPSLIWGYPAHQLQYHRENFMATLLLYLAEIDPSLDTVAELAGSLRAMVLSSRQARRNNETTFLITKGSEMAR